VWSTLNRWLFQHFVCVLFINVLFIVGSSATFRAIVTFVSIIVDSYLASCFKMSSWDDLAGNSNEINVNAKKYLINEIVSPWLADKFLWVFHFFFVCVYCVLMNLVFWTFFSRWALIAKVDSVDCLKSARKGGCIYSSTK
jgi:hypothetical protein